MNIDALLTQSLQLLGLGMGSVFIILSLLIGIISIVSKLVPEEQPIIAVAPIETPMADNNAQIAAIQAAIHKYRQSHKH